MSLKGSAPFVLEPLPLVHGDVQKGFGMTSRTLNKVTEFLRRKEIERNGLLARMLETLFTN